ncbi:hypothetical protein [Desulfofalx alkaliphila]|uniref:hypothetical protein n=1 Tax=Desulfofalx alkaliphila TaxID=105483 RepID=UPI0004E1E56C|nr:hypothetical protein [Desulfofalx alkaliphila]
MNEEVIFGIGGMGFVLFILTLITIIAVTAISQISKNIRAKNAGIAEAARDEAYRKLAEESISAQQKMVEKQENMANDIADIKARISAIEKMLREVG